jgi:flagellar assembly protein FliH
VTERDGMKVRLNPQDFHYITEIKEDFLREMDGVKNIVFEEDPGIKAGGVMVETMFGEVDARLEQQFDEIRSGFGVAG